jgi:hypothetical protein
MVLKAAPKPPERATHRSQAPSLADLKELAGALKDSKRFPDGVTTEREFPSAAAARSQALKLRKQLDAAELISKDQVTSRVWPKSSEAEDSSYLFALRLN